MRKRLLLLALVAILVFLSVSQVLAQSELTLEGLAEQVTSLVQRVEALESFWESKGSRPLDNGACVIAAGELQRETALKFYDQYEKFPENVEIQYVVVAPEENMVSVTYSEGWDEGRYSRERWIDCEFLESIDWVEIER